MVKATIGVIGGSGLYAMADLKDVEEVSVDTPFGKPSDSFIIGTLDGVRVAFLPRHGRGHRLLPTELPFRANIYGMKQLGVERILSASAVGSLNENHKPLDITIPDQFIDRTRGRQKESTFFGDGLVAHIAFANPVCHELGDALEEAGKSLNTVTIHRGGTYVCMEGPAFSTKAESNLYRSWGADLIGMTNLQEAKLAREAEICYATLALVTDFDCWHPDHDSVTVEMVISNLVQNSSNAQKIIKGAIKRISEREASCKCQSALKHAIMTQAKDIPPTTKERLSAIVGKYLQ
ncbi:MAG TPA: S-methyl-5'-thioadenosine phosphorylase [Blastocatellia bacterium]|nr:S-methyl-5'-thioadenosine phosphorylase [Blastocatellia bacterium]